MYVKINFHRSYAEKCLKYFYKNEYLNGIPILRGMNTNKRILFT